MRVDEVIALLVAYALGEIDLSERRIEVALKLIDLMLNDELPPDAPDEAPVLADADDRAVLVFPPRIAA